MRRRVEGNTTYVEDDNGDVVLTAFREGDIITLRNGDWVLIKDLAADPSDLLSEATPRIGSIRFRFYDVTVELRSDLPYILRDVGCMYSRFVDEFKGPADMTYQALSRPTSAPYPYVLLMQPVGDLRLKPDFSRVSHLSRIEDLLLQVHNELEVLVLTNNPRYGIIHGAAVEKDGVGYVMPADTRQGKTTLALALLSSGYRFMTDEFAVLDSTNRMLLPYPRTLSVRAESLRLFPSLFSRLSEFPVISSPIDHLYSVDPVTAIPCEMGSPCPVGYIIFPRYDPVNGPSMRRISKAEAVKRLVGTRSYVSLGLLEKEPAMDLILSVISRADCCELLTADLSRTVDLVRELG